MAEKKDALVQQKGGLFPTDKQKDVLIKKLKKLDDGVEITSEYLVSETGEEYKAIYLGTTELIGDNGPVKAVRLLMEDGTFKTCASTMLVSNLSGLDVESAIMFVKTGTGTSAKKMEYDIFSIKLLGE